MANTIQLSRKTGLREVRDAASSLRDSLTAFIRTAAPAIAGTGAAATIAALCAGVDNLAYMAAVISLATVAIADHKPSKSSES